MSVETLSASKRPKDKPFFQQSLPAWQPMFTARKSAITFLVIGAVFIPLGAALLVVSNSVIEYTVDYTDCKPAGNDRTCSELYSPRTNCTCTENVKVSSDIPGPVYLYYALDNFYQNHRRYARSKSDSQLLGHTLSADQLSSCYPYGKFENSSKEAYAILPCGAIANSLFNDTFAVNYGTDSTSLQVPVKMTSNGIAWKSDVDRKFGTLSAEALADTVKPFNWQESITKRSSAPFKTDEEFIVWMRVAALPNFRKLHRRIVHEDIFIDGLPTGTYEVTINYAFPVSQFGGRKSFVIGNVSFLGGRNRSLGILALITGLLHLALGILFLVVYIYSRNRGLPQFFQHLVGQNRRSVLVRAFNRIRTKIH